VLLFDVVGIWPYIKILLSLLVWVTPTKYIGVKRRGTILLWIDALAKLSVVDIFTLVLGVAVLLVFIGGPDQSITSDGLYFAMKAIVIPKAGCYCILIAQRMSRASSRFLLDYHEMVVNRATVERADREGDISVTQICIEEPSSPRHSRVDIESELPSMEITGSESVQETTGNDETSRDESSTRRSSTNSPSPARLTSSASTSSLSTLKNYRWGYWGAVLAFIAIVLIFAIGCIFAPAIAFDLGAISGLAMESGKTFEEAVSEYGVFVVVSGILVRANFVLDSQVDYIGLGLLLFAVGISMSLIFIIKAIYFIKRKLRERLKRRTHPEGPSYGHEGCGLPFYFRLFQWHHMEIYLISFAIGVWQLGAIASYSMYAYCDIMTQVYDGLTFLGIAEPSTTSCFNDQATNGGNLIIIFGSLLILSISFFFEARTQYKKNIDDCMKNVDERDVPRLSLAWSRDKSKNSQYSHLTTESLSFCPMESFAGLSTPPLSPGLTRTSSLSSQNGAGSSLDSTSNGVGGDHDGAEPSSSPQQDREHNHFLSPPPDDHDQLSCPVASPCSVASSSRRSGRTSRSGVIDAICEMVTTPPASEGRMVWLSSSTESSPRDGASPSPPLMPSWSHHDEDDPREQSSSSSLPILSSPPRLSNLFHRLPFGPPRRSLPPPTETRDLTTPASAGNEDGMDAGLSRRRRIRSSGDIVRYMEENPRNFD
jgi:hypothetical protein